MSRRNNNHNNQYNQYYGNGQYYNGNGNYNGNGQYYNPNGQQYYNPNQYNSNRNGQYYSPQQQYYKPNSANQNQQQPNKFGIAPQQPEVKKEKKKRNFKINKDLLIRIGLFAVFAIVLIVVVGALKGCNKEEDVPVEYEDEYKVIGSDALGYLTVPGDWVVFKDKNSQRGIRYSDPNGDYIISLDALSTTEINAQDYALGTANQLEEVGVSEVKGATVKLAGYEAYQVYGYHKEQQKWVLAYFFEGEDGNTHYVGIEGPDKENEAFKIPDTFKLKK